MIGGKNLEKNASAAYNTNPKKRPKEVDFEERCYKIVSLGTIISGILMCLVSLGVGMGLVLAGTVVFAEL